MQILFKKGNLGQHDLQIQDDYGSTPLHFASVRNRVDSVAFLRNTLYLIASNEYTVYLVILH